MHNFFLPETNTSCNFLNMFISENNLQNLDSLSYLLRKTDSESKYVCFSLKEHEGVALIFVNCTRKYARRRLYQARDVHLSICALVLKSLRR